MSMDTTYRTVDEIFKNLQIPEIKSLEVSLRSQSASKHSELRLLVGESYRDLLTTADTIVDMRDKTVLLRRQLNGLAASCDSVKLTRKVANLQALPNANINSHERVLLNYVSDLRSLVICYIKKGDLVNASRLYSLGRLIVEEFPEERSECAARVRSIRQLLLRAIDKCTNIETFALSFATTESASPRACLEYFLALQAKRFEGCESLRSLALDILRVVNISRDFGRLQELFQLESRRPLLSLISHLPELDSASLTQCLSTRIRQHKVNLENDSLDVRSIDKHVQSWLNECSAQTATLAAKILAREQRIDIVLKDSKEVRNILDEASQIAIYDNVAPAVDTHISGILSSSLEKLRSTVPSLSKAVEHAEDIDNLWISKIPWTKGSLQNFKATTNRVVMAESTLSAMFSGAYLSRLDEIKNNLRILKDAKNYQDRHNAYLASIEKALMEIVQTLQEHARETTDSKKITQILRFLLLMSKTSPMPLETSAIVSEHFPKLLPGFKYVGNTVDLSATFDRGLPIAVSPAVADYLFQTSLAVSSIGIDLLGPQERKYIRESIAREIRAASSSSESSSTETLDPTLPQHRAESTDVPSGEHARSSGSGDSEAVRLQATFDLCFMSTLLSIPLPVEAGPQAGQDGAMRDNVARAVGKSKVLYGSL